MKLDTSYTSVTWRTNSDGVVFELEVEREVTFLQWLFRKPATKMHWQRENNRWWNVYATTSNLKVKGDLVIRGSIALGSVDNKELTEIYELLESIELHKVMMAKYE